MSDPETMTLDTITVRATSDWRLVHRLTIEFADRVLDDEHAAREPADLAKSVYDLVRSPSNVTLQVLADGQPAGAFLFMYEGWGIYEVHTLLQENCRGEQAIKAARKALAFIFGSSNVVKLISYCPTNHPEVLVFARRAGFRPAGYSTRPWVQNGVRHGLRKVELTRKDYLCQ